MRRCPTCGFVSSPRARFCSQCGCAFAGGAGYPSITVPAGAVHGLPVGISFFGRAFSEPSLIRLAYAFQQVTLARKLPACRPTLELEK